MTWHTIFTLTSYSTDFVQSISQKAHLNTCVHGMHIWQLAGNCPAVMTVSAHRISAVSASLLNDGGQESTAADGRFRVWHQGENTFHVPFWSFSSYVLHSSKWSHSSENWHFLGKFTSHQNTSCKVVRVWPHPHGNRKQLISSGITDLLIFLSQSWQKNIKYTSFHEDNSHTFSKAFFF